MSIIEFVIGTAIGLFAGVGYGLWMQRETMRENEIYREALRFAKGIAVAQRLTPLANHLAHILDDEAGA